MNRKNLKILCGICFGLALLINLLAMWEAFRSGNGENYDDQACAVPLVAGLILLIILFVTAPQRPKA